MAKSTKSTLKLIGLVLLVVGTGLAVWGYQMSGSIESGLSRAISGSETDKVMTLYISGAVGIVVGLFLLMKK